MMRSAQSVASVNVPVTIINTSGTNQVAVAQSDFRVWVYSPAGQVVSGFSGMTPDGTTVAVTALGADTGVYLVSFPSAATTKAFTDATAANPYTLIVDTVTSGVDPVSVDVWIGVTNNALNTAIGGVKTVVDSTAGAVSGIASAVSAIPTGRLPSDYPTQINYNGGAISSIVWHSGVTWTYQYTAGNLTAITEA